MCLLYTYAVIDWVTSLSKPLRQRSSSELVISVIFIPILQIKESGEEVAGNFLELIQMLLKDPEARQDFFMVRHYHLHLCGANVSFHYNNQAVNDTCYYKL